MRSLSPADVHATADAYLIDVREGTELEQARIDGAHHIPLGELVTRLHEVPRDRTVYVFCHVGGRSAQAVAYLEQQGVDAVNVDGGIVGWYREGLPVELGGAS